MDCVVCFAPLRKRFAFVAGNDACEKKAARAALGDRSKPRALWKEEVGEPALFSRRQRSDI
jgi:hypothetical protein